MQRAASARTAEEPVKMCAAIVYSWLYGPYAKKKARCGSACLRAAVAVHVSKDFREWAFWLFSSFTAACSDTKDQNSMQG